MWQARYQQTSELRQVEIAIEVDDEGVRAIDDESEPIESITALSERSHWLQDSADAPKSASGMVFGRHLGFNAFAPAGATVTDPSAKLMVGSSGYRLPKGRGWPSVPTGLVQFHLRGEWVVALTDVDMPETSNAEVSLEQEEPSGSQATAPERVRGILVMFVTGPGDELEDIARSVRSNLPAAFKAVDWGAMLSLPKGETSVPADREVDEDFDVTTDEVLDDAVDNDAEDEPGDTWAFDD